jgi:hypothetical protein
MKLCVRLLVLVCLGVAAFAQDAKLPDYVVYPSQAHLKNVIEETYNEADFNVASQNQRFYKQGRHWTAGFSVSGMPDGTEPDALMPVFKPALVQAGWTVLSDPPGQSRVLRYQKNGHDAWLTIWFFQTDDVRFDMIEIAPCPVKLTLKAPAAKPETITDQTKEFPYLASMPGTTFTGTSHTDGPMMVIMDDQDSQQLPVGTGYTTKGYSVPQSLQSPLLFDTVYKAALIQAGWKLVHQLHSPFGSDTMISAHYTANGRDLWTTIHAGGEVYTIDVADAGTEDIGKELDKDCHVALYGILFDFNKATLRPDSNPVLQKVLALLQSRPTLKLEVQGHTDNVGSDDYNLKLSDARATTVADWLIAKGIAADRVTAKGYGLRQPIADNGGDEGRAKNRRVELKKQDCGK